MLINAFSVNIKGNKDVKLCNKLNKLIYRMLSHSNTEKDVNRVPMILTQSEIDPKLSKRVVVNMKKRLGVNLFSLICYTDLKIKKYFALIYCILRILIGL